MRTRRREEKALTNRPEQKRNKDKRLRRDRKTKRHGRATSLLKGSYSRWHFDWFLILDGSLMGFAEFSNAYSMEFHPRCYKIVLLHKFVVTSIFNDFCISKKMHVSQHFWIIASEVPSRTPSQFQQYPSRTHQGSIKSNGNPSSIRELCDFRGPLII